mgnify:CR=1 FL=1
MEINVGKLNELPEGSYQLIDMRSDRDFEYGTIPGAIHISQEDLQGNPQIIKSKKVILFCAHGTNSIEAAEELEAEGYRAYSLEGGYIAWLREEMRRQEAEDIKNQVEQSIRKKFRKTIWSPFTKAVKQYELVKEGDKVSKGQVLGIVEAMKLMNEIESEFDGTVKEILVENEQMVEFGQPMFVIE